jgi:predicted TIM-barrel fold metal-dependent hydrolase
VLHSERAGNVADVVIDVSLRRSAGLRSTRTVSDLVLTGTLTRYPNIEWVFTHGGGTLPLLAERMELVRTMLFGGNHHEPSVQQQVTRLWFDLAGTPFPRQVPALIDAFGADRLLYGSDYCWTPAAGVSQQIAAIDTAVPPDNDTWRALTTRNAARLLPLTAAIQRGSPPGRRPSPSSTKTPPPPDVRWR